MNRYTLTIIVDPHFEDWQSYEVYDNKNKIVVLRTDDWERVAKLLELTISAPEVVIVT